jgi:hypothetical protein
MVPTVASPSRVYAFSYAMKTRYRAVGWLFITIGVIAAGFLAGMVLTNSNARDAGFMLALVLGISAVPILEGVVFLRGVSRVSVTLTADVIHANGLLHSRTLRLADIAGKAKVPGRGGMLTYLVPRPNCSESRIRIPDDVDFDDTFNAWLAALPDLNESSAEMRQAAGEFHWRKQEQ